MSDASVYDANAPKLRERGYFPLSIGPNSKKPQHFVPSLNEFHDTQGWTHPARQPHAAVQVLSDGRQTVVPPSLLPDIRRPYTWTSKYTLYNVAVGDLPILPDDYIAQIETILRPLGYEAEAPKPETNGHDAAPRSHHSSL